jgi:peptidoglycan hydrolase CwlO-like protein
MKLKRKKIIAREFLILLSCVLISCISFIGIYPYNFAVELKIDKFEKSINHLTDEIKSLENSISSKLSKQKWYYNENEKRNSIGRYNSYSELWKRLENIQKSDSIVFKWNYVWNTDLIRIIKEIGFETSMDFDKFIFDNTLNSNELKILEKIENKKTEITNINNKNRNKENKIMNINDQINFALLFLVITGIIAFPMRYLFYSIKWSIRTIKQKE